MRYDTDGKRNRYRLKHPVEVRSVIAALSRFVKVAQTQACNQPYASTFPEFRKRGSRPDELRWDAF